jgi:hypothetical protein
MENTKYHNSEQFQNPTEKSQKEATSIPLTYKYMILIFLDWYRHFNTNCQGSASFIGSNQNQK